MRCADQSSRGDGEAREELALLLLSRTCSRSACIRCSRGGRTARPARIVQRALGWDVHAEDPRRRPAEQARRLLRVGRLCARQARPDDPDEEWARRWPRTASCERHASRLGRHPGVLAALPGFHRVTERVLRTPQRAPTPSFGWRQRRRPARSAESSGSIADRMQRTSCPALGNSGRAARISEGACCFRRPHSE